MYATANNDVVPLSFSPEKKLFFFSSNPDRRNYCNQSKNQLYRITLL